MDAHTHARTYMGLGLKFNAHTHNARSRFFSKLRSFHNF